MYNLTISYKVMIKKLNEVAKAGVYFSSHKDLFVSMGET